MGNSSRYRIAVNGTVQGVGFRPFIYRLATEMGLFGHVYNHSEGVTIEVEGDEGSIERFKLRIASELPPLAHIQEISTETIETVGDTQFKIIESSDSGSSSTLISPDIAPCDDCIRELLDKNDRRHVYPFINCTNCGPRYSIIQNLPYDRPMTTMKSFELCDDCREEYENPSDRRFHAQPNACERCGPKLSFIPLLCKEGLGKVDLPPPAPPYKGGEAIERTIRALANSEIIAIKGLGGYHLACDATNDEAVKKLRDRKQRDEKPFAIMVGNIEAARALCHISKDEEKLLTSPQRPIVLLKKKYSTSSPHGLRGNPDVDTTGSPIKSLGDDNPISNLVAPGNQYLGVMLPSTPLHQLLFAYDRTIPLPEHRTNELTDYRTILVMTSGNISDEPIAFKDEDAFEKLKDIADTFLTHDRDIHIRIDDSITRCMDGKPMMLRRARGYTPTPVRLNFEMPQIFAAGADLKNAICLTKGHNAFLSQHLGDMENLDAHDSLSAMSKHLMEILDIKPEIVACDMHPDYFSTRFAKTLIPNPRSLIPVQHHHAHIASCMAENDLTNEEVIGIALDGTGFGTDGTVWGGEILIANYEGFKRAAHFQQIPMPGGDIAAKEPWRMAVAYLSQGSGVRGQGSVILNNIDEDKIRIVQEMIEKDINCPKTSSCGRLFDAVAAMIGIRNVNSFEGQAAMELEQIADRSETGSYEFHIIGNEDSSGSFASAQDDSTTQTLKIDFSATIASIIKDLQDGKRPHLISMRFHNTIIEALVKICKSLDKRPICLSGGCFQNAILATKLKKRLVDEGFTVYTHSLIPPNDGGVALGQAVVAAHKYLKKRNN